MVIRTSRRREDLPENVLERQITDFLAWRGFQEHQAARRHGRAIFARIVLTIVLPIIGRKRIKQMLTGKLVLSISFVLGHTLLNGCMPGIAGGRKRAHRIQQSACFIR
jgi:hypothetical protein